MTPHPADGRGQDEELREALGAVLYGAVYNPVYSASITTEGKRTGPTRCDYAELAAPHKQIIQRGVDAILAELRRRGAWLPGDPATDAMVDAALVRWYGLLRDDDHDDMRAAITAALEARKPHA